MNEAESPVELATPTIRSIQVLRGVAATAVVLTHAIRAFTVYNVGDGSKPGVFALPQWSMLIGVDIFFVISGFIMFYISGPYMRREKSASDFFLRRLIRIYPMYIFSTLVVVLLMIVARWRGDSTTEIDLAPGRLVASAFFIPSINLRGSVAPILGVGWTLTYEMYFYGVFALSLAMAGRRAALVASATMIAVCGLANLATGASATVVFLRDTHVLEFVSGLVVGALFKSGRLPKSGAVPIAAIAIASLLLQPADLGAEWDWLFLGGPATLLVVSCLAFERRHEIRSRSLLLFGDASYSIYLLHMSVIYDLVLRLMHRVHVWPLNNLGTDATIGAICVVCVIAGVIGYLLVEKPLTSLSRRLYEDIRRCARNAPLAVT